jgi:hypothetical protein
LFEFSDDVDDDREGEGPVLGPASALGGRLLSDSNCCVGRWVGLLAAVFEVDALDVLGVLDVLAVEWVVGCDGVLTVAMAWIP